MCTLAQLTTDLSTVLGKNNVTPGHTAHIISTGDLFSM